MKLTVKNRIFAPLLIATAVLFTGCSSEDDGLDGVTPDANTINEYLLSLDYNPDVLLEVQDTGGEASRRDLVDSGVEEDDPDRGTVFSCNYTNYDLYSNFDEVAILRPSEGVIYPGALVVGNNDLKDGDLTPFAVPRAPVTVRVDLPGIGENGNLTIDNPARNSEVDAALDGALEWWNANAFVEGYRNEANSTYQATTSYASKQMSFDLGLNAEWANGSVAAQFNYESSSERRVAAIAFKQVFYTVTMDTPLSPATVFGSDVSYEQVASIMNAENPPAYVSSVSYGRIIMVRMETTNMDSSINLNAVLEYGSGRNNATGTLAATFDEVLQNSSLSVITIGGNAEVATSAVNNADIDSGPGSLDYLISGENAVYRRDNPGAPIAYTVRYLKDNRLAKMGYTTDYRIEQCGSNPVEHEEVTVENDCTHDIRFRFKYRGQDSNTIYYGPWVEINQNRTISRTPTSGAHDVEVETQWQCGAGAWRDWEDFNFNYVETEECIKAVGGSIPCGAPSISEVNCN